MQRIKTLARIVFFVGLVAVWILEAVSKPSAAPSVHFVNALPFPVEVQLDGASFQLATGARVERPLPAGEHEVRVVRAGKSRLAIEEQRFDLQQDATCAVYNVAGAAPLIENDVAYAYELVWKYVSKKPDGRRTFHGHDRFATYGARFCFTQPPDRLSTNYEPPSGQAWRAERHLELPATSTWHDTIINLASSGRQTEAVEVARRIAVAALRDRAVLEQLRETLAEAGLASSTAAMARDLFESGD